MQSSADCPRISTSCVENGLTSGPLKSSSMLLRGRTTEMSESMAAFPASGSWTDYDVQRGDPAQDGVFHMGLDPIEEQLFHGIPQDDPDKDTKAGCHQCFYPVRCPGKNCVEQEISQADDNN